MDQIKCQKFSTSLGLVAESQSNSGLRKISEHELRNLQSKFLVCQKATLSDTQEPPVNTKGMTLRFIPSLCDEGFLTNFKIATPVSHLFKDKELKKKIAAFSDVLELRDNHIEIEENHNFIYHCELNILAKWSKEEIDMLKKKNERYPISAVSFHLASRYQENYIENMAVGMAFVGKGTPYSVEEMKKNVKKNCKVVKGILDNKILILLENTNYLLTDAYDIITDPDFICKLIEENDIFFLLDLAHARITAINKKVDFKEYLAQLPLERCKQIHLSRADIKEGVAADEHNSLQKEDWSLFEDLRKRLKNIEYVTIEYYKDGKELLQQLEKLKKIQDNPFFNMPEIDTSKLLKIKEWDTSFFGFSVAGLDSPQLDEEILIRCVEEAKKSNIKCIYCLSDENTRGLLRKTGFFEVDERVEFEREIKKDEKFDNGLKITEANKKDALEIKEIARSAFRGISRFYRDKHFDQKKADTLYETWIDKLMKDPNSTILIIKDKGAIAAFNGVSFKDGEADIELIAVNKNFRGKGYGNLMIDHTLRFFHDKQVNKLRVITQGPNVVAKKLYNSKGFAHKNTKYWFHWWNEPGGERI